MSTPLRHSRNATRGFNLIELTIVLGVIGLVFGAIFIGWETLQGNNRIKDTRTQVLQILDNIRSSNTGRAQIAAADYADYTRSLIQAEMIPPSIVNTARDAIVNAWGGPTQVRTFATAIRFRIEGINGQPACRKLVNAILLDARARGLASISSGGVTVGVTPTTQWDTIQARMCPGTGPRYTIAFDFNPNDAT